MTDLTPLTSAELVDLKAKAKAATNWPGVARAEELNFCLAANPETILRLIDMIERRDEQIEKLRKAITPMSNEADSYAEHFSDDHYIMVTLYKARKCREALAATESPK